MAQLPKGSLVRGHDKPIHGSCAIYFRGDIVADNVCWKERFFFGERAGAWKGPKDLGGYLNSLHNREGAKELSLGFDQHILEMLAKQQSIRRLKSMVE